MSDACDHFITEGGKCIACGEVVENPRWTMEDLKKEETSETFRAKYLNDWDSGNIPAITSLAEQTWAEYDGRATANEEPDQPQKPRLRLIGHRLMRIPFHQIWREVLGPSYDIARQLGYRGDFQGWQQFVKECQPPEPRLPDPAPPSVG